MISSGLKVRVTNFFRENLNDLEELINVDEAQIQQNKSKKFLGVNRFNLMTLNKKAYFVALGGINEKNYKMIKLLRTNGFASISWAKKNGLRKLRPF